MTDPALRLAALQEMSSIRSQLIELEDHRNRPLGRLDSLRRYSARLEERLGSLERQLRQHEQAVLDHVKARRCSGLRAVLTAGSGDYAGAEVEGGIEGANIWQRDFALVDDRFLIRVPWGTMLEMMRLVRAR